MITTTTSGRLRRWFYDVGEQVHQDDALAEIETDSAAVMVYAPQSGRLTEMMVLAGDLVEAGRLIGRIHAQSDQSDVPAALGDLLEPPGRKPRRKTAARPGPKLTPTWGVIVGLLAAMGLGTLVVLFITLPLQATRSGLLHATVVPAEPLVNSFSVPVPTQQFVPFERAVLNAQIEDVYWGAQVVIQDARYEAGVWFYTVKAGQKVFQVSEQQLQDLGVLAPTPTMQFDFRGWDWSTPLRLKEAVADFPAGTRVQISAGMFNGVEWELEVVTENGITLRVREAQLELPAS